MKRPMTLLSLLLSIVVAAGAVIAEGAEPASLPKAEASQLPRWRGFNLTNKFHREWSNRPFEEDDFRWIHEFGFNVVRLPMDYRTWIVGDDWTRFNEEVLKEIDEVVAWGETYGIHVSINFHRAPGYTVASPAEETSLWTDAETQRVCALHWAMFARRYRGIPNERLSFNLFNEPANVAEDVYVDVVRKVVAAIREEDPERLIISDGMQWGQQPIFPLAELDIAQATRGYTPMDITHYRAGWVSGSDQYPQPTWPRPEANGTLYAPGKGGMKPESLEPAVIEGPFPAETTLRMRVMTVSGPNTLVVRADGRTVWERRFTPGPGEGEWKEAVHLPQWNVYQNVYDRDYEAVIPAGTERVELAVAQGDWVRLAEIGLTRHDAAENVLTLRPVWDEQPVQVHYRPAATNPFVSRVMEDRQWLWETKIVPWQEAQAAGIGVMVGEFGCHNRTPHDVVLAWMEDNLANWQEADWGWALWNFRGSFGILDSGRDDVEYEDFHGRRLDRKMLELLQRY